MRSREKFTQRMARWARRGALLIVCALVVAAGGVSARQIHLFVTESDFFNLEQLEISGASEALELEARQALLPLCEQAGDNLFAIDTVQAEVVLGGLPRAEGVSIHKRWPDRLEVIFTERRPLMVAKLDEFYLIDQDGYLLAQVQAGQITELGMPILTGVQGRLWRLGEQLEQERLGEVLEAARFIEESDPTLSGRIVEWHLSNQESVTAILRTGAEVRFGIWPPLEKLETLSGALVARGDIEQATYIDLRNDDQIVYN